MESYHQRPSCVVTGYSGAFWQDYREIKDMINTLDSLGSDLFMI